MRTIRNLSKKKNSIVKLVELSDQSIAVIKYYPLYSRSMFIEMNILATCCHQNINNMKKLVLINKKNKPTKIKTVGMVMDRLNISYMDLIQNSSFGYTERVYFLLQIAYGIRYLHSNNILHLDLKPDNIMVTNNNCKIIDFGTSEYIFDSNILTNQIKCTATHRAPEGFYYLENKPNSIGTAFDIWSLGIIILETFTCLPIYCNKLFPVYIPEDNRVYDIKMFKQIMSQSFIKYYSENLPTELVSCLDIDPLKRPNINQIICHLTNQLLEINLRAVYNFDNRLTLVNDTTGQSKITNNMIVYYERIKKSLDNFPDRFIWYTDCLIRRISYQLGFIPLQGKDNNEINKKYIDQAIMISLQFYNHINDQTFAENFYDKKILDHIIILTNGMFFHYNNY